MGLLYDGQAKVEVSSSTLYESVVLVSTLTGEAGEKKNPDTWVSLTYT